MKDPTGYDVDQEAELFQNLVRIYSHSNWYQTGVSAYPDRICNLGTSYNLPKEYHNITMELKTFSGGAAFIFKINEEEIPLFIRVTDRALGDNEEYIELEDYSQLPKHIHNAIDIIGLLLE